MAVLQGVRSEEDIYEGSLYGVIMGEETINGYLSASGVQIRYEEEPNPYGITAHIGRSVIDQNGNQ